MNKRRFLAVLLAVCMTVESTATAFATETETGADGAQALSEETPEAEEEVTPEEVETDEDEDEAALEEPETLTDEEGIVPEGGQIPEEAVEGLTATYAAQPMTAADGEEDEVVVLRVAAQTYGKLWLQLSFRGNEEITPFTTLSFNIYRSETEDGDYGDPIHNVQYSNPDGTGRNTEYHYIDNVGIELTDDKVPVNKVYYYKVSVLYGDYSNPSESSLSRAVTNQGMYYYGYFDYYLNEMEGYIGGCIIDEKGDRIDQLTIHEGETKKLRIARVKDDGSIEALEEDCDADWYVSDQYYTADALNEKIRPGGNVDYSSMSQDWIALSPEIVKENGEVVAKPYEVYMTALSGSAADDPYYLILEISHAAYGHFLWQIPLYVEQGDGTYEKQGSSYFFTTKDALMQAIRDAMVNREKEAVFYATEGVKWWFDTDAPNYDPEHPPLDTPLDMGDIFDFNREREGMKPWEGDYLQQAMGTAESDFYYGIWLTINRDPIYFNHQYYEDYIVTPSFITTKEQEDWVNDQIDKIIYQPGGELYDYRDASDYNKIKAAFEYVINHVDYIGTPTPIYHTCYSALKNGKATCQGYALLYYRLLRELGIPNRVLMGVDTNAHGYNIVKLGDAWYYVDTTSEAFLQGEKDFNHAELQSQYLTDRFKREYISKISQTSYSADAESKPASIEELSDEEIKTLDDNLLTAASRMSATYTINGAAIKASGTVKYIQGCTKYLGYEEGQDMPSSGYFLAMKLKADTSKFTEDGYITISYLGKDGTEKEIVYRKNDLDNSGYLKLLLNITEDDPNIKILIDNDTDGEASKYEASSYRLDTSALVREAKSKSLGSVKEIEEYGIGLSSPAVSVSSDGTQMKVSYDVVAHSTAVKLPGTDAESDGENGNYIALQLNVPEAVKDTAMLANTTVEETTQAEEEPLPGEEQDLAAACYIEKATDFSNIRFVIPVKNHFTREFTIKWGGEDPSAFIQKLTISVPERCILESRNENALLPDSIAFNGLVSTMYVGQSQNVNVTFKKKYEQDVTQLFFTSDKSDVVMINRVTGEMKALKAGTAEIKVSAVDKAGNTVEKTAKITVKDLTVPASVKISAIKDSSVTVSWKANTTGQYTEVYAIPFNSAKLGPQKAGWKEAIERAMQNAGMEERTLASLDSEEKEEVLSKLGNNLGAGSYAAEYATADISSLTIKGLQAETEYVFYVRNTSATAVSTTVFAGAVSDKITTKSLIFASIELKVEGADTLTPTVEDDIPVYKITEADRNLPLTISYVFLDEDGNEITNKAPEFKSVKFNTGNKNIVKTNASGTASATLSYGAQVGDARIYVTGKDSSGTARESKPIIIRVIKQPSKLANKTTTLTIGQDISIQELIGTDLKGSMEGMDLSGVDFAAALKEIEASGCFAVSYPEGSEPDEQGKHYAKDAVITAAALKDGKSGNSVEIAFDLKKTEGTTVSSATAKITVKDMIAPTINRVTVKDTSAIIQFKPSFAGTEKSKDKYYTVLLTDTVTKEEPTELSDMTDVSDSDMANVRTYTCAFTSGTVWSCEIKGLSGNKTYEAVIVAHYNADSQTEPKKSKPKKFTTTKPLLVSEGSIDVNYIELSELRENPNGEGIKIDYNLKDQDGNEVGINLETNRTYVFMAQVSKLARALETDKLKWAISSGDKKAASLKASSSTYEMQLTTSKIGTFTVTATSTVTKEVLATFKVNVIPYQSGGTGTQNPLQNAVPNQTACLPETETGSWLKSKREEAA